MSLNDYFKPISYFQSAEEKILIACYEEDIESLKTFSKYLNLNKITDKDGDPLLHFVIYFDKPKAFDALIRLGVNVNIPSTIDGNSPLHFAALLNKQEYATKLMAQGADVNLPNNEGTTPLLNALAAESDDVVALLLNTPEVNVNIPNHFFYVPLLMAYNNHQPDILEKIINHPTFDSTFHKLLYASSIVYDFVDMLESIAIPDESVLAAYHFAKEFGHKFDFNSCIPFTTSPYRQFECLPFEGLSNRISISLFSHSLTDFYENIVASSNIPAWASQAFNMVNESFRFSAENMFNPAAFYHKITLGEVVVVPSGWQSETGAHSITFVFHNNRLYYCNRGEGSDDIHGITEFIITKPSNITENLLSTLLLASETPEGMQQGMMTILGLEKIGEIENPVQTVSNCTWTSLEAALEASLLTRFLEKGLDNHAAHTLSKTSFATWEEYDLSTTLLKTLSHQALLSEHGIYDDLLIKTLEMRHDAQNPFDVQRGAIILNELRHPDVFINFDETVGKALIQTYPSSYTMSAMKAYEPTLLQKFADYFISSEPSNEAPAPHVKAYYDFIKACDVIQQEVNASNISLRDVVDYSTQHVLEEAFNQSATLNASPYESDLINPTPLSPLMPLYGENEVGHFA